MEENALIEFDASRRPEDAVLGPMVAARLHDEMLYLKLQRTAAATFTIGKGY